ncbi:hypothetical protein SAMN02745127_02224, partial [Oceanospirillum multiglobuliferum]
MKNFMRFFLLPWMKNKTPDEHHFYRRGFTPNYIGDCSPPFRARLPTSQAATGAWPDLRKPPLAGT